MYYFRYSIDYYKRSNSLHCHLSVEDIFSKLCFSYITVLSFTLQLLCLQLVQVNDFRKKIQFGKFIQQCVSYHWKLYICAWIWCSVCLQTLEIQNFISSWQSWNNKCDIYFTRTKGIGYRPVLFVISNVHRTWCFNFANWIVRQTDI